MLTNTVLVIVVVVVVVLICITQTQLLPLTNKCPKCLPCDLCTDKLAFHRMVYWGPLQAVY